MKSFDIILNIKSPIKIGQSNESSYEVDLSVLEDLLKKPELANYGIGKGSFFVQTCLIRYLSPRRSIEFIFYSHCTSKNLNFKHLLIKMNKV